MSGRLAGKRALDILANNAGIDDDTPFLHVDRGRWRDILATNLTAPFVVSQAVARVMRRTGGGAIVQRVDRRLRR